MPTECFGKCSERSRSRRWPRAGRRHSIRRGATRRHSHLRRSAQRPTRPRPSPSRRSVSRPARGGRNSCARPHRRCSRGKRTRRWCRWWSGAPGHGPGSTPSASRRCTPGGPRGSSARWLVGWLLGQLGCSSSSSSRRGRNCTPCRTRPALNSASRRGGLQRRRRVPSRPLREGHRPATPARRSSC